MTHDDSGSGQNCSAISDTLAMSRDGLWRETASPRVRNFSTRPVA
jgi:hypothetical protein